MNDQNTYGSNATAKATASSDTAAAMLRTLSQREREVFHWICEGKRDREIAQILGISYRTVTVHVRAILQKLCVENRTCAAMVWARANT